LEKIKNRKADSLTACIAYIIGVDVSEIPGDEGLHLSQWLAGQNLGLVPVESPESFEWPGRFLGLRGDSSGYYWTVCFGAPPGIVYDPIFEKYERPPEEPPEGPEASLEAAFVLANRDPLLGLEVRETGFGLGAARESRSVGKVELVALSSEAEGPMTVTEVAEAVESRGLRGDRYERGAGTFSDPGGRGNDLTLVEAEALEELASTGVELAPEQARRNLIVRGIDLDSLIGRHFRVGEVECFGQRRCEPCAHLEKLTQPGVLRGLVHRGGLRADVLSSGELRTGDRVEALP
jgi:MOSC domain-containing protein YiiM